MKRPFDTPTLFIECTHTYRSGRNTGIQRVVRNVLRNAPEAAAALGLRVVPLVFDGDRPCFIEAAAVLDGVPPPPIGIPRRIRRRLLRTIGSPSALDRFGAGSILLLLDSSWDIPLWPAVRRFKARGGRVASVIYDLIPLSHPDSAVGDLPAVFRRWLQAQTDTTDAFLCISAATATELGRFVTAAGKPSPIAHFRLGSELDLARPSDHVRPEFRALFAAGRPSFLMVGSIEPRKRHGFALDAFERYWQQGGTGALVMLGRQDWRSDGLLGRIASHPERDKRLFLIRDAGDAELDHAYRHATALIMASSVEGFGLPIVEAFQRGLPVLCSDIPVFREVAVTGAAFFPVDDPNGLARMLSTPPPVTPPGSWLTWRDSTVELFDRLAAALDFEKSPPARHT
ncbi:MAG: FkbM family methyltransferase [Rhodospirillales bacterium]|nr:FkbM family methyltransferase [Rhodospirillales bacterium]